MYNPKKIHLTILLVAVAVVSLLFSCQKESSLSTPTPPSGKQLVSIHLNDEPIPNMLKVLVDIRYIEVKVDTGTAHHDDDYYDDDHDDENDHHDGDHYGKWDTLSNTAHVYDLLQLKNGVDTIIANGYANLGKISKVRITLGTNNVLWTDSTHSYPLVLCDNEPYIYVNVKTNTIDSLPNGQIRIRIDFDVAKSIEFENNKYCFEPKLTCYTDNNTGQLKGIIKPREARSTIMAYNSTDTAYAIPEENGEFKIKGLKPNTYSVRYKATAPYKDTLINSITVIAGQTNALPTITLHP